MKRITSIPVIAAAIASMSAVSAHAMDVYNCKELIHCLNNSIDITLMNDIKMDNNAYKDYIDFGYTCCYKANIDGQGHKIYGIKGKNTGASNIGLIHYCAGSTIKNLTVEYDELMADKYVGGIAGQARYTKFENCHVTGDLKSDNGSHSFLGGITGYAYQCDFKDCTLVGHLYGDADNVGGIAGCTCGQTEITNCKVNGYVFADGSSSHSNVGGIVGVMVNCVDSHVKDCTNNAKVEGNGDMVGGIIGEITLSDNNEYLGSDAKIVYIPVDTKDENKEHKLAIENCTNNGEVKGSISTSDFGGSWYVGGIVGTVISTEMTGTKCYSNGNVEGRACIGGLMGGEMGVPIYMHPGFADCVVTGRIYCSEGYWGFVASALGCGYHGHAPWSYYRNCDTSKARIYVEDKRIDGNSTQSLDNDFDMQPAEEAATAPAAKKDVAKKVMVNGKLTLVKSNGQTVDISGMMR